MGRSSFNEFVVGFIPALLLGYRAARREHPVAAASAFNGQ
jgi:hypothetical protein